MCYFPICLGCFLSPFLLLLGFFSSHYIFPPLLLQNTLFLLFSNYFEKITCRAHRVTPLHLFHYCFTLSVIFIYLILFSAMQTPTKHCYPFIFAAQVPTTLVILHCLYISLFSFGITFLPRTSLTMPFTEDVSLNLCLGFWLKKWSWLHPPSCCFLWSLYSYTVSRWVYFLFWMGVSSTLENSQ